MFHVQGLGAFNGLAAVCNADEDPEFDGCTVSATGPVNTGGSDPFHFPIGPPTQQTAAVANQQAAWNAQLNQILGIFGQQQKNPAGTGIGLQNQNGQLNLNSPIIIAAGIGLALILLSRR
jgi:hypothetical protein